MKEYVRTYLLDLRTHPLSHLFDLLLSFALARIGLWLVGVK